MDANALPVLALGAWLKNTACLLGADGAHAGTRIGTRMSGLHGDLGEAQACLALEASARSLLAQAGGKVAAIAHDLHPDFYSTRLAQTLARECGVPAIAVQHHHAHIGAVMAERGLDEPVIGLALDGVGLGTDGTAWGGELVHVAPGGWRRLGHLWPLALPGGDAAAREPWRMLASVLHAMGRGGEIAPRLAQHAGAAATRMVASMLDKRLNCPPTTSAGRWFDAAAAALGLHLQRQQEAEAAMALEQQARQWLDARGGEDPINTPDDGAAASAASATLAAASADSHVLDLRPLLARLIGWPPGPDAVPAAAAWFHLALADALAGWAAAAAERAGSDTVCLGGGCFMNAILTRRLTQRLQLRGLRVYRPQAYSCGDAGLALGQAWVAARQLTHPSRAQARATLESPLCA